MKKNIFYLTIFSLLAMGLTNCNSNKIACPSYSDSFPNSKKKKSGKLAGLPDDQAPGRHHKKPKSVLPGDGPNGKRVIPN